MGVLTVGYGEIIATLFALGVLAGFGVGRRPR